PITASCAEYQKRIQKNSPKTCRLFTIAVAGYLFVPSTSYAALICATSPGGNISVNTHFDFKRNSTAFNTVTPGNTHASATLTMTYQ
ncbi:hypothetical protein, partial [Yersinia aleksiciae]|uniref:hypothetical protein n=1 Tax=Yersinia aleksiciae TaxID=263819 RepID=UPI001C121DE4